MSDIGFIGLGNMGLPMAKNLLKANHRLKVFDLNPAALEAAEAFGAAVATHAIDAAQDVDAVITMLPNGQVVESTYLGDSGILRTANRNPVYIDCSTIDPGSSRTIAEAAHRHGREVVDAPVSGGIMGAREGTLCFIVGGEAETVERIDPILRAMGKSVIHAGEHGAGQLAKICNNLLAAVLMVGTAEALALGARNGLSPRILSDVIRNSSGRNFMVDRWNPWPGVLPDVPSSHAYNGGFQVNLMLKDLGLALNCAQAARASVPLGALASNLFALHDEANDENSLLDISSIQHFYYRNPQPA
ncbi:3-hydroxyisobutyrate dehydrogenase [Burkholderia sp. Bp9143]|uniref:3-hydroxyisobutyrate dehydrogenase n=1 Tax=Burkholderia sp. Bp9143 TaxID=2184574 RepID=UPI000F5A97B1|nr:3-hydroxyisobutyrate dehydrogenase [Burkholderia sp. Bp9143]RQR35449.1 3-hydroxyisobutyrate dehydrogenase [Burkholderia sp. Bp9143]